MKTLHSLLIVLSLLWSPLLVAQERPVTNARLEGNTKVTGPFTFNNGNQFRLGQTTTILNIDNAGNLTINDNAGNNVLDAQTYSLAANGILSVDFAARKLWHSSGTLSVDWTDRLLVNDADIVTADWNSGLLIDTDGFNSVDWEGRALRDNAAEISIGWQTRKLYSSAGVERLDYSGAYSWFPNGNMHMAAATGTSSAGRFLYIGDSSSAGITLERTTATAGKYSFFTRGTGDFGFYDELNSRYAINVRKSDGVVEFPLGVDTAGSVTANSGNASGKALLSGLPADPANYGGLWFGSATSSPTSLNYTFLGTSGSSFINAGTNLYLRIANNNAVSIDTGSVDLVAGLKVASGTKVATLLSNSASLDYASIGANAEATLTLTVTGVVTTNTPSVSLGWSAALTDGIVVKQAWVSAANTVSVRVRNTTGAAIDPTAVTCRATVFGF